MEAGNRYPLATVLCLTPEDAQRLKQQASQTDNGFLELSPVNVTIPATAHLDDFDAVLFTRIQAFEQHRLLDYEAEITLPLRCNELMLWARVQDGDRSYELTVFENGRAIVKGTEDPATARSVYARFVGG